MFKIAVLVIVALLFTGCTHTSQGDPFAVFDGAFSVKAELVCEESTSVLTYDSSTKKIEFESPSELCGYVVCEKDGRVYLSFEGIDVPLAEYSDGIYYICQAVFCADAEDIKSIGTQKRDGRIFTSVETKNIVFVFDEDGIPIYASGVSDGIEFNMSFSEFSEAGR